MLDREAMHIDNIKMLKDPKQVKRIKLALKGNRKSCTEWLNEASRHLGVSLYAHNKLTAEVNELATKHNMWDKRHKALKNTTYKTFMEWYDDSFVFNEREDVQYVESMLTIEVAKGFISAASDKLSISDRLMLSELLNKIKD